MNELRVLVMGDAAQGVNSATKEVSGDSRPAPDPEVAATAKRRQSSSKEKRRILAAADRCSEAAAIGALLRRTSGGNIGGNCGRFIDGSLAM